MHRSLTHALIASALSGDFVPTRSSLCGIEAAAGGGGGAAPAAPAAPAPKAAASAAAPGKPTNGTPPASSANAAPTNGSSGATANGTPPAVEPAKDPAAIAWAKLSAAERKLAADRAALTQRATELTTREKAIATSGTQAQQGLEALRERAKKGDHDAVLAELGLSYRDITQARIRKPGAKPGAPSPSAGLDLDEAIAKGVEATLAKREAEAKRVQEEGSAAAWKDAISVFEGCIKTGGAERYEMLTHELTRRPSVIHDAFRELAVRSPELTFDEAADKIEEFFVNDAARAAKSPKVRALLEEASKQAETDRPRAQPGQATADVPRTLTNSLAAERASTSDGAPLSSKPLSRTAQIRAEREAAKEEERRVEALARR